MAAYEKTADLDRTEGRQSGTTGYFNSPLTRRDALKFGAAMLVTSRLGHSEPGLVGTDLLESMNAAGDRQDINIFPRPQQIELAGTCLTVDEETTLLLPRNPSEDDHALCRLLTADLSDRFGYVLRTQYTDRVPASSRFILLGSFSNPLVQQYCRQHRIELSAGNPGPEGYLLQVDEHAVVVGGSDPRGAFYGLQSLRQLVARQGHQIVVPGVRVRDWPDKTFRGMKLFLPGRSSIPFFKRFVANFLAPCKINTLVVQMNACMRLDHHPELNMGWVEFVRDVNYSRRNYPRGALHGREQNASHQDCCDGGFLEKMEVADLVQWTKQNCIEFVPEIPSMTHAYYLLSKHPELSEVPGETWPDTYCPANPKSHELLFEVMDEFIEVTQPKMVHAAHDEWFAPFGLCACCRGRDPGELYGEDLRKVHDYLAGKNLKMAIWGDYLLESVRGAGLQKRVAPDGWTYYSPGAMRPRQVEDLVPKDILIFNWFWQGAEAGLKNESRLEQFGFRQIYGNMDPSVENYSERSTRSTILGGAPSSWAAVTEYNLGKDLLAGVLGCSALLWSKHSLTEGELSQSTQSLAPKLRPLLSGITPPSSVGDSVVPVDITPFLNSPSRAPSLNIALPEMSPGIIRSDTKVFRLPDRNSLGGNTCVIVGTRGTGPSPLPYEVKGIKIGQDVTSLIFLHACARPATNKEAFRLIWDENDSADLLGWYEVVYDDGLPEIIAIRYGVNILEWNRRQRQDSLAYCHAADEIVCGEAPNGPVTFFSYEWSSPRLGKVVEEVRLRGSNRFRGAVSGFENAFGEVIPDNAILLTAISMVPRRS